MGWGEGLVGGRAGRVHWVGAGEVGVDVDVDVLCNVDGGALCSGKLNGEVRFIAVYFNGNDIAVYFFCFPPLSIKKEKKRKREIYCKGTQTYSEFCVTSGTTVTALLVPFGKMHFQNANGV